MPNPTYLEPGTAATGDLTLFSGNAGGASTGSSVTTPVKSNPRSLKCATNQFSFTPAILTNAGNRQVFWFQFDSLPSAGNTMTIHADVTSAGSSSYRGLQINSAGNAIISSGASSKTGTTVYAINTWYRVTVSHVIVSTTNFTIKLFITSADDVTVGTAEVTATNADFTLANSTGVICQLGVGLTGGVNSPNCYFNSLYIDDGTTLDDPGDKRATKKKYNATSTNNYDTTIGTGTNRWDYVSDLPLNTANGLEQTGSTQVAEVFGIEDATTGDIDISRRTITGYMAWIHAKAAVASTGTPKLVSNGNDNAIVLTVTAAPYTVLTTSGVYPTGAFGMKSTGTVDDTFFYEGGVIIGYDNAALMAQACF